MTSITIYFLRKTLLLWVFIGTLCATGSLHAQNLNQLLIQLDKTKQPVAKVPLLQQIGGAYQQQSAHKKAIEYFETAHQIEKQNKLPLTRTLKSLGYSFKQLGNYRQAIQHFEEVLQTNIEKDERLDILEELATLHKHEKNYAKAIEYTSQILAIHQNSNDIPKIANAYNNLGYLYKKADNQQKSLESYNQALTVGQKVSPAMNANARAIAYINTGVAYTSIGKYREARSYYIKALDMREKQGKPAEIADTYNYLAVYYYLSGNNSKAIAQANKAIDLAEPIKAEKVLVSSYKLLSEVYQQEKAFEESQKYFKKHQELKDKMARQQRVAQQKLLQKQVDVEKQESKLKALIAERNRKEAELKQSELERKQQQQALKLKEQELALLKRNQELQQEQFKNQRLEKERVEQLLALAEQKANTEKQKRLAEKQKAIAEQRRREAEKQKLVAAKEKAERMQQSKALEAAQKEKELQQEQLKQEKTLRKYGTILLILGALLLGFVLFAFIASQRGRRKLKQQKEEIATQNEELQQNHEEIMSQRDFIEKKNKEMEFTNSKLRQSEHVLRKAYEQLKESEESIKEKNSQIHKSITAAQTIQQAILPYHKNVETALGEHFIMYAPKDVVSGDFYWIKEVQGKVFLIAADCTGHGVPGAFMSMIGKALIDKLILIKDLLEPAEILHKLHDEIKMALRQEETGNNNGMDLVILRLEHLENQVNIMFAGAKSSMYYIEKGITELQVLKGDRRSIGGYQNDEILFNNQQITLPKGSLIYVGSDGFVDQNNVRRRSFGNKRLNKLLLDNMDEPLSKQKQALEEALKAHMEGTTQRDDILFIGVKL
ncbi:tetratricopeptide repeat protein [Microscilla marina]|uniref:Serine/threonine protein kinases, putative n=1 Tax=Microscilla marina ATCC 23134 TaxID=313606 RepID=A1ZU61_MICM2|nr:tetratricopeptide repeat protein [Microscilla marina]EAY26032.1 serine/threonine protein kinases, putative [Microscilla marina ATCC 23134]